MSATDWTTLGGGLSGGSLDQGVTTGITPPNGGGSFIYGFNSLDVSVGTAGKFVALGSFVPMAKGGSIRGALQRGISGGPLNFSPFLFIGAQGTAVTDLAYMIGLQDDDPHRIVVRKGAMNLGLPAGAPGTFGTIARSTATYAPGTWLHVRLDMIANANGDVLLQAFQNDLVAHTVSTPTWVPIPGIPASFVDDSLHINTGSAPYMSGRCGFGFRTADISRRGFVDFCEAFRQI